MHLKKKSQVMQIVLFMMVVVSLAFVSVLTYYIIDNFYNAMDDMDVETPAMQAAENTVRTQVQSIDYAIIFLMVALIGGLIVTSFFIPSHPIFFAINIIGIFVLIFIGMIMSNVYGELVAGNAAVAANLSNAADIIAPKTTWFINYLPFIGAALIGVVSIVMFAKGQGQNGAY